MINPSPCVDTGSNGLVGDDIVDIDRDTVFNVALPLALGLNNRKATTSAGVATADMGAYEQ